MKLTNIFGLTCMFKPVSSKKIACVKDISCVKNISCVKGITYIKDISYVKNIVCVLSVISFLTVSGGEVSAQPGSLQQSYREKVKEYSKEIKASGYSVSAGMEKQKSAKADFLPSLSGNADFQYTGNALQLSKEIPSLGVPVEFTGRNSKYGASLTLAQPLYTGGALKAGLGKATAEKEMAVNESQRVTNNILYDADTYYWNKVALDEIKNVALEYMESVSALADVVKGRVDEGYTDRNDLLMTQVKLNDAEYRYIQACNKAEVARMSMNSFSGVPFDEIIETDTIVQPLADEEIEGDYFTSIYSRPELDIAGNLVEIEKYNSMIASSRYLPSLSVGVSGSYSSPGYDFMKDMDPNYAVYVNLSVPIFEWGKRKNTRRIGEFSVMKAEANRDKIADDIRLEIETARYSYTESVSKVLLTENSLEKAEESENLAKEKYLEGTVSIVEVINAQIYHQDAKINYIQSKLDAQIAKSALLRAMGVIDK